MIRSLSAYMAKAIDRPLPAKVAEKTKHHIADSLAAIVSGAKLLPGRKGIEYVSTQGGVAQATVMGTTLSSSVTLAAFANAMSAHADETDGSLSVQFRHGVHMREPTLLIPRRWRTSVLPSIRYSSRKSSRVLADGRHRRASQPQCSCSRLRSQCGTTGSIEGLRYTTWISTRMSRM